MPELPEAEVVARQIRLRLLGGRITEAWIGRSDIVREGLASLDWYHGATLTAVERRGKCVVLSFSREGETRYLIAELGMTGLLFFKSPGPGFEKHTHMILTLAGAHEPELRYWNPRRFGRLYLLDRPGLERFLARRFGCDPMAVPWEVFRDLLKSRRGRLKALLMHQQAIAGIGNI